ncbi:MAG: septal ring lytic transglycosylase RlpA family protein [Cyanobacteria bacterium]|jgi:rare lipoprotein A|nr:septal ring lytic transglycosylase RlpA family protein [Cyanobacteria bacterium GSL.Bin21]
MKNKLGKLLTLTLLTSAFTAGFVGEGLAAKSATRFNQSQTSFQETHSLSQVRSQLIARMRGRASWYGPRFHGRRTASGERFNAGAYTAAHRSLPFGTKVRVTNLSNGRAVVVRINDRGPYAGGRVIDLSKAAARAIGMIRSGTAPVRIEILGR